MSWFKTTIVFGVVVLATVVAATMVDIVNLIATHYGFWG